MEELDKVELRKQRKRESNKKYRDAHKEEIKAYSKKYWEENKDDINESRRKNHEEKNKVTKENNKEYRDAHKYLAENKGKMNAYQKKYWEEILKN